MSAVEMYEGVRPIARWDREPSEFWEALTRIVAELRYNPRSQACRLPKPDGPVRRAVIESGFSGATKERLCQLVSQLPWLLPTLERWLATSRDESLERINHYRGIFRDACDLIDLKQFSVDKSADPETRIQQRDALSRAMLLKSELLLIIAQFDFLREDALAREHAARSDPSNFKAVA
jgi:hypothetical protein